MQQTKGKKYKKEENGRPGLAKETLQKTLFTSVLTTATEIHKKTKGKNPDKMFQLIFPKIQLPTGTDTKILYIFNGNVRPYIQINV